MKVDFWRVVVLTIVFSILAYFGTFFLPKHPRPYSSELQLSKKFPDAYVEDFVCIPFNETQDVIHLSIMSTFHSETSDPWVSGYTITAGNLLGENGKVIQDVDNKYMFVTGYLGKVHAVIEPFKQINKDGSPDSGYSGLYYLFSNGSRTTCAKT